MKLTAQMSFWAGLVLGLICLGVAVHGWWQSADIADDALRADAHGFALFWLFLGVIGLVVCVLSGLMARGKFGPIDQ